MNSRDIEDKLDQLIHWFGCVWVAKAYNTDYKKDKSGDQLLELVEDSEAEIKAELLALLSKATKEALERMIKELTPPEMHPDWKWPCYVCGFSPPQPLKEDKT